MGLAALARVARTESGLAHKRRSAWGHSLRTGYYKIIVSRMGKTKRHQQAIYLDHDKAKLLDELAKRTRLAKQVLLRDAVDLLLKEHGLLKPPRVQK